jgi:hypothetical protein
MVQYRASSDPYDPKVTLTITIPISVRNDIHEIAMAEHMSTNAVMNALIRAGLRVRKENAK